MDKEATDLRVGAEATALRSRGRLWMEIKRNASNYSIYSDLDV